MPCRFHNEGEQTSAERHADFVEQLIFSHINKALKRLRRAPDDEKLHRLVMSLKLAMRRALRSKVVQHSVGLTTLLKKVMPVKAHKVAVKLKRRPNVEDTECALMSDWHGWCMWQVHFADFHSSPERFPHLTSLSRQNHVVALQICHCRMFSAAVVPEDVVEKIWDLWQAAPYLCSMTLQVKLRSIASRTKTGKQDLQVLGAAFQHDFLFEGFERIGANQQKIKTGKQSVRPTYATDVRSLPAAWQTVPAIKQLHAASRSQQAPAKPCCHLLSST